MVKRIFKEFEHRRAAELTTALLAVPPSELAHGIGELYAAGELRLVPRRRRPRNPCAKFYSHYKTNPQVAGWYLQAAQSLKNVQRGKRYGIGALTEQIR